MKLLKIQIDSYKSIVKQTVNIEHNCIGLIGLNESGKTNVLQALSHLDSDKKFTLKDKSKITEELPIIHYHFEMSDPEVKRIQKRLEKKLLDSLPIVGEGAFLDQLKIESVVITKSLKFDDSEYKNVYEVNIDFAYSISNEFKEFVPNEAIGNEYLISFGEFEHKVSENYFHKNLIPVDISLYFREIEKSSVLNEVKVLLHMEINNLIPQVKYWEFNSQYLIPAEITYTSFMENDNPAENNAPLFNMLLISDLDIYDKDDLKAKVSIWKKDSSIRRKDSNIITRDVNEHVKNIWIDYDQELKIELEETKITIHVNDPKSSVMNYYDMDVRSQGFKTFMSFILTISAEFQTGFLEDHFLILDEPETHLHPSGVKYMKNELLKLAQNNNYVFFATHSIFMIDRGNLRRHLIVSKESEQTRLTTVTRNNILQEDVIFQALGTSVDDFSLSNSNLLFEGELDVKLFSYFISKCLAKKENKLIDYDFLDGGGTKRILKFFCDKSIPTTSKWTIVLDNDSPGRKLPEELKKCTIGEVYNNMNFVHYSNENDFELEDILPSELISGALNLAIGDWETRFELDLDQDKSVSRIVEEFYGRNGIRNGDRKRIEEKFKIELDGKINDVLNAISKETSIASRRESFQKALPSYYEFLKEMLTEFDILIE
ncbi:MAG: AAA family ATPase [Bacteroidia bacterium]|nr:AAA family ATPase [Bacteroidia bacterium]